MQTALIFLMTGFCISFAAGFYFRDRRTKAADAEAAKRTASLNQQIQNLHQTIVGMEAAPRNGASGAPVVSAKTKTTTSKTRRTR
jgi:hypothetical protein